ncbi:MarR family transcriptional regulator [Ferrovibrio sp.]|uniref:MarR family winged helix-turn-helix transcriptional regulator n=1 Tax=Ferrovibrio sp. TaxID=1917215 RepID=UPI00260661FD|nr:MarR family transcriptional regulator [Ferrovibrio sp.]
MALREDTTANLLGALGVAVFDHIRDSVDAAGGHGGQGGAALTTIGMLPGLSVGHLAGVLGLTHPGTVRLVERLVAEDLVEKTPSAEDGRALALKLTPLGRQRRRDILSQRNRRLQAMLETLTASERRQFDGLLRRILGDLPVPTRQQAYQVCRYCDAGPCFRNDCPVDEACPEAAADGLAAMTARR